ncbi:MAG: phosphotransferase [Chloroflexi bacterium]|nr:phosphotransferase [Chloroflexota bacterium]
MADVSRILRQGVPMYVGPRAQASTDLFCFVSDAYRLGEISSWQDIGGSYSLNVRLDTSVGRVVLRVHRPWVSTRRLESLQQLRRFLSYSHSVVLPLATAEGVTWLRWRDRLVECEPYVEHDAVADDLSRDFEAFRVLGTLHAVLRQVPRQNVVQPLVRNYAPLRRLRRWITAVAAIAIARQDTQGEQALAVCALAQEILAKVQATWWRFRASLPCQLIHGDYGGENVLFSRGNVVAVLDWDFCGWAERVYELAYSVYFTMARHEATFNLAQWHWANVCMLVGTYEDASQEPLTTGERQAFWAALCLVPLYWVGEALFLNDPIRAVGAQEDKVRGLAASLGVLSGLLDRGGVETR